MQTVQICVKEVRAFLREIERLFMRVAFAQSQLKTRKGRPIGQGDLMVSDKEDGERIIDVGTV
jgi:hypothetical protein